MYEDITVRQYMNALFKGDRSVMNDEETRQCNIEYIDTAGLYETEEFNRECYIQHLTTRVNVITISLKLQRDFLEEFGTPYLPALKDLQKFGHNILWTTKEKFLKDLIRVEKLEKSYISQLEIKIKELEDYKRKKDSGKPETIAVNRGSFIRTINSLGKIGFKIDMNSTTMEELAYMIKQQLEENKKSD
jgi:hypothetical protein